MNHIMCRPFFSICVSLIFLAHAEGQVQQSLDELLDRARSLSSVQAAFLDGTTLGKAGQIASRPQTSALRFPAPSISPAYAGRVRVLRPSAQPVGAAGSPMPTFKPEEVAAIKRGDTIDGWDTRGNTLSRYPPKLWPAVYNYVVERGLKTVTAKQAQDMVKSKGAALVDVRMADATIASSFDRGSAAGAVNIPVFRKVEGSSLFDYQRRAFMTFFGMEATETNPNFEAEARAKLPTAAIPFLEKPIIIICDRGGQIADSKTMTMADYSKGQFNTRSLKAAYELYQAGFNNLYVLEGGLGAWEEEGLPMDVPEFVKPTFTLPVR